jgi:3-hydroxymyristoyl/3-hydroxydecanoyl-(acyl carrier protein) dehydratases
MTLVSVTFAADHPAFAGHFPGHPIVPGVLLLDHAQRIITIECGECELRVAKFLSPANPGEFLDLEYSVENGSIKFEIRSGLRRIANGQFSFRP